MLHIPIPILVGTLDPIVDRMCLLLCGSTVDRMCMGRAYVLAKTQVPIFHHVLYSLGEKGGTYGDVWLDGQGLMIALYGLVEVLWDKGVYGRL